jgi:hypothetical protein
MIRRYHAVIWLPKCDSRHRYRSDESRRVVLGRFATAARAERAVERQLARHPSVGTRERREHWALCWAGDVYDARADRTLKALDAPEEIALSVGELGYW